MAMDPKGISPMIAVVLLIAFTVAVGGIVSLWLTSFTSTTQQSVGSASTNQTKCASTYIDIISVTADGVIITARGSQNISNPVCYWGNGTLIDYFGSSLSPGSSNSSSKARGDQTSVVCSGSCLNIGVTGECNSEQSCWK
jgi:flagellin-like protein